MSCDKEEKEKVEVQCPKTYDEAKICALKGEKYYKDKEYVIKSPSKSTSKKLKEIKSDMKDLTSAFGALKICQVDQNSGQDDRMNKIESSIKELTKAVIDLKDNKSSSTHRIQKSNEEHISRNCPTMGLQPRFNNLRNEPRRNEIANPEVGGVNICYFETTESMKGESDKCLMIQVEEGEKLFDVKNLGKRRRVENEHEMPTWARKSAYINTPEEIEQ
ncbi:hypothetical protein C2G38_2171703 [Gigaspora rosea]|uniref:Uncharacterized protein n=1 Tax=Gigaspora rosea TaxID=44941 RepID=A0A397VN29_9GLOM|nr:hypothetical protein C2G38_2171703 [Gigaspora rosea]